MSSKSRLPKPSGLPIPKIQINGVKLSGITTAIQRFPETQNLVKFTNEASFKTRRQMSPDLESMKKALSNATLNKAKMRRSRSACDLREHVNNKPLKRLEHTLAPIHAKITKSSSQSSIAGGKTGKRHLLFCIFFICDI